MPDTRRERVARWLAGGDYCTLKDVDEVFNRADSEEANEYRNIATELLAILQPQEVIGWVWVSPTGEATYISLEREDPPEWKIQDGWTVRPLTYIDTEEGS